MKLHILGTEQEIETVLAVLRGGLDAVEVDQQMTSSRDVDLTMVSLTAARPWRGVSIQRDEATSRSALRRFVADLEPPTDNAAQRRPRRIR